MNVQNNAVATIEPRRSLLAEMAGRYGMEPKTFADTLRATVVPKEASNEEFAAFLVVAREYNLNPLTKEIYAFPKRGGGIQPILSIDGWLNIINSHPQLNGIEFDDHLDKDGKVTAITARIWRKDREKPIVVTEYMSECVRATDTWKGYPRRMLRHKALIQCARYAFGFAGIVDPDEAERIGVVAPRGRSAPQDDGPPPPAQITQRDAVPLSPEIPQEPATEASFVDLVEGGRDDGRQEIWDGESGDEPPTPSRQPGQSRPITTATTGTSPARASQNSQATGEVLLTKAQLLAAIEGLRSLSDSLIWSHNCENDIAALDGADRRDVDKAFNAKTAKLK